MIVLPFLAGGATLVASALVLRLWLGALPRTVCPSCGQATVAVGHRLSAHTDRWIRLRWCSACDWAGWGRNGPVLWERMGPVAHDSGFRWGEDRLQPDFGFRWAEHAPAGRALPHQLPSDHPSGFQWKGEPGETVTESDVGGHPSGFRFRESASEPVVPHQPAPGFRWRAAPRPSGFQWKA